jgi:hypothetical protein
LTDLERQDLDKHMIAATDGYGERRKWLCDNRVYPGTIVIGWTIAFHDDVSGEYMDAVGVHSASAQQQIAAACARANGGAPGAEARISQRQDVQFQLVKPKHKSRPGQRKVSIECCYRRRTNDITNQPDTVDSFVKDAEIVEGPSTGLFSEATPEQLINAYVGQHGPGTQLLRNIQHMTAPGGVHATMAASGEGEYPTHVVITWCSTTFQATRTENDVCELMQTYPSRANGGHSLKNHRGLLGFNSVACGGDLYTYVQAYNRAYVQAAQRHITARLAPASASRAASAGSAASAATSASASAPAPPAALADWFPFGVERY